MPNRVILSALAVIICLSLPAMAKTNANMTWDMQNSFNEFVASVNTDLSRSFTLSLGVSTTGRMQSDAGQTFAVQQLGLSYHNHFISVFGGAMAPLFDRAAHTQIHHIFLPETSPAVPHVGYNLNYGSVSYTKLCADISRRAGYKRLGVHHIRWQPVPYLALGFGEAVVASQPFPGDLYYYSVPILPYYLAKYFPGINTSVDNAIFYGDGRLSLPRMTLYGELLVNEFPMAPTETNPKLYALTLGLESKALIAGWDLLLEVCRVSDQAYSNGRPENVFTYGEQSLGHVLGDDLTAADIRFSGNLPKLGADARFGLFFLRLGNTDVAPWIGEAEPVTPEETYGIKMGVGKPFNKLQVSFDLELGYVLNDSHKPDQAGYHSRAVLKASWQLP
ncbi:MAG: hypothetical protein QM392_04680 [Bacillota bacterium]|jgi:hypothetical protein|nr:hypothetical protein [Bacillota bacterium]NLL88477.1 hypothetical protein [Bacillota bacterium]HKM17215.1 hypothetical protein [Limnochordia bacterium]